MRGTAVVLTLCVLLAGCATVPKSVEIPVAVPCPPPPEIVRPHLPILDLSPESPPDNVIRAFAASIEVLAGYAAELETILSGYRPASAGPIPAPGKGATP